MRQLNVVPADDIWFCLDVNYGKPMRVVLSAGHSIKGWKYLGPKLFGRRIIKAKIIRLGYVRNLSGAEEKADILGFRLVNGQAIDSFKGRFPICGSADPVIFGGSEWQNPRGKSNVVVLTSSEGGYKSLFHRSDDAFLGYWRWLVVGKAALENLEA